MNKTIFSGRFLGLALAASIAAGGTWAGDTIVVDVLGSGGFSPSNVTIRPGDTVKWVWQGGTHSVKSDTNQFDSGQLTFPAQFSHTFINVGSFPYHCDVHPTETGTVTVSSASIRSLKVVSNQAGVPITVSPPDINGQASGETDFTRLYNSGDAVTLTAPHDFSGQNFVLWEVDGTPMAGNPVVLTMSSDRTARAVFAVPNLKTVEVTGDNPGITIKVSPPDDDGFGDGVVPFTRSYQAGSVVTFVAPSYANGQIFYHWVLDGVPKIEGPLEVTVNDNVKVDADYRPQPENTRVIQFDSELQGSEVSIKQKDAFGQISAKTPFARAYPTGTEVRFVADGSHNGEIFSHWIINGRQYDTPDITLIANQDYLATTYYKPPLEGIPLSVSADPQDVSVTVSPPDLHGDSSARSPFNRFYDSGTDVTLSVPAVAGSMNFSRWVVTIPGHDPSEFFTTSIQLTIEQPTTAEAKYSVEAGSGDINQDGSADKIDAQMVLDYLTGTKTLDDDQKARGDVNADGDITIEDAVIILKRLSGRSKKG